MQQGDKNGFLKRRYRNHLERGGVDGGGVRTTQ